MSNRLVTAAWSAMILFGLNSLSGAAQPAATVVTHKAPIAGLIDRKGAPTAAFYPVIDGYVVNVNWADLQPAQGGPITANNAIDAAISQVRAENSAGAHLALKLRLFAGTGAPGWAKSLDGPPINVRDRTSGRTGTVGRFWLSSYEAAYADFQAKLAAIYDAVPEIREVTISGCMTTTAEPFLRQVTDPGTIANLWNAGYTAAADQACQQEAVKAHLVWQQTFSDLSFNPFQAILSATSYTTDEAFTASMISYCRQILGELCILENNSLRSTSMSKNSNAMYASIAALGANISFQTAILSRIGSLPATLDLAVGFGAGSVELPNEYRRMAPNTFDAVRLKLIANSRP